HFPRASLATRRAFTSSAASSCQRGRRSGRLATTCSPFRHIFEQETAMDMTKTYSMENRTETHPTIEELQQKTAKLEQQNAELSAELKRYKELFHLAQQKRFGASTERTHPDQLALELFNEAEAEANPTLPEPTVETITYKRKKKVGAREAKHDALPVETIEYRLSEEEQVWP